MKTVLSIFLQTCRVITGGCGWATRWVAPVKYSFLLCSSNENEYHIRHCLHCLRQPALDAFARVPQVQVCSRHTCEEGVLPDEAISSFLRSNSLLLS